MRSRFEPSKNPKLKYNAKTEVACEGLEQGK